MKRRANYNRPLLYSAKSKICGCGIFCKTIIKRGTLIHRFYAGFYDHPFGVGPISIHGFNHSCDPNAVQSEDPSKNETRARRDIAPGEEITLDYNHIVPYSGAAHDMAIPCQCGSTKCRKTLFPEYSMVYYKGEEMRIRNKDIEAYVPCPEKHESNRCCLYCRGKNIVVRIRGLGLVTKE